MRGTIGEPGDDEGRGALARNALFLLVAQALSTALAVVLNAALGRGLGVAEYGLFFLTTSMAGFAYVVVEWGQTQYVVREIAQHPQREADLLGTTIAVRVVGVSVMAALTAGVAWALGYDARTCRLSAAFVGAMLPYFLAQAASLIFRARERMEYDAFAAIVDRVLTLAATLAALWLGVGLSGAAGAVGIGGTAALFTSLWFLHRLGVPRPSASRVEALAMLWGGAAIVLTNVEGSVQPYIDAVVLSKLTSPESVGLYGAARTFVGTLVAPAIILSVAVYPRLSRAALQPRLFSRELRVVMRPIIGLGMLAGVGTYLFANAAVDLVFGEESFAAAGTILQLLAPGLLLLFVDNVLAVAVVAVGRPAPLAMAKLVSIAACAGLALLLVPVFERSHRNGGMGLAIASGATEIIMFGAAVLILPRESLDPSLLLDLARALAAGAGTLLLFNLLPPAPLFAGVSLCILTFGALALALRLVRVAELVALLRLLRRAKRERVPSA